VSLSLIKFSKDGRTSSGISPIMNIENDEKLYLYTNFDHGSYEADTVGTYINNLFFAIFSHIFW
jgi:hypothetical protein